MQVNNADSVQFGARYRDTGNRRQRNPTWNSLSRPTRRKNTYPQRSRINIIGPGYRKKTKDEKSPVISLPDDSRRGRDLGRDL
ncbi:MAG: hypothetical protein PVJ78_10480, partial [Gammaproteobacteria bacterium]